MGWLEGTRLRGSNPLVVFGRVPLFYYLVHLFTIHGLAVVLAYLRYGNGSFLFNPPPSMGGSRQMFPANYGCDLWTVYAVWLLVIVLVYPICRWFAALKQRRRDWWLSYL